MSLGRWELLLKLRLTVRWHTVRCVCAVRKVGYLGPILPDAQGDRSHYCVPMHRTTPILIQSKNSGNELKTNYISH